MNRTFALALCNHIAGWAIATIGYITGDGTVVVVGGAFIALSLLAVWASTE